MLTLSHSTAELPSHRRWFPNARQNPRAKLRLFCFPYAGGGHLVFQDWHLSLSPDIEVVPVHLPNRGNRLQEPGIVRIGQLVALLLPVLMSLSDVPFALFGHSMGALVAFELARALQRSGCMGLKHVIASGHSAPDVKSRRPLHALPENELISELVRFNGTDPELLENDELMNFVLPRLRADFELVESYNYVDRPPLRCGLSVYGGVEDFEAKEEDLHGWKKQAQSGFNLRMFPGGHFFLKSAQELLLRSLQEDIHPHLGCQPGSEVSVSRPYCPELNI